MPCTLRQWFEGETLDLSDDGPEGQGDAALSQRDHATALARYASVENPSVRLLTKLVYCDWVINGASAAMNRLAPVVDEPDEDVISLLANIALDGLPYAGRDQAMATIWPRIKAIMDGENPPLLAYIARLSYWWPEDKPDHRTSRLTHAERAATLYSYAESISLVAATEYRIAKRPPADIYDFLLKRARSVPSPRYAWVQGLFAIASDQYDKAVERFRKVEQHELSASDVDQDTLTLIRVQIAGALYSAGDVPGAFNILEDALEVGSLSARLAASRAALAIACACSPSSVDGHAVKFISNLVTGERPYSLDPSQLSQEMDYIRGRDWDDSDSTNPWVDLRPFRERLLEVEDPRTRAWLRAMFTVSNLDEMEENEEPSSDIDWKKLGGALGSAAKDSGGHPLIVSLDAAIKANLAPRKWTAIARAWVNSELDAAKNHQMTHGHWIISAISGDKSRAASFAADALPVLERKRHATGLTTELFGDYIDHLFEHGLNDFAYRLAALIVVHDESSAARFNLGLAAHRTSRGDEAFTAYQLVLSERPAHYAALYNSLLLCKVEAHRERVSALTPLVEIFPSDDAEKRGDIQREHAAAIARTTDPNVAARQALHKELASLRAADAPAASVDSLSLRDTVALFALLRACEREPDGMVLRPFDGSKVPFSSHIEGRRAIFGALRSGLIVVDPQTKLDAFVVKDDSVHGWHLGRIWWRVPISTLALIDELRDLARHRPWPTHWLCDVLSLAKDIGKGEVEAYIRHLADDRGWPAPENDDDVSALADALLLDVSVAEAYYLAYLGAMSASDYKQRYPINAQQAANSIVKRAGQKLESVRANKFPPKSFERSWQVPRSAMSRALWEDLLNMGDEGFTRRIDDELVNRLR